MLRSKGFIPQSLLLVDSLEVAQEQKLERLNENVNFSETLATFAHVMLPLSEMQLFGEKMYGKAVLLAIG